MTDLRAFIRDVPDFPTPGILFRDITPLLASPEAFARGRAARWRSRSAASSPTRSSASRRAASCSARAIARELGVGLRPGRASPESSRGRRCRVDYGLEYGKDSLEVHADAFRPGERVLIADDVLATGGTARGRGRARRAARRRSVAGLHVLHRARGPRGPRAACAGGRLGPLRVPDARMSRTPLRKDSPATRDGRREDPRRRRRRRHSADRPDDSGRPPAIRRSPRATGARASTMALELRPDLILLDVMMPELSGWEVCTTLKNAPETRQIPIAMLTVKNEIRDLITGMQAGADDYITKPFTRAQASLDRSEAPRERRRLGRAAYPAVGERGRPLQEPPLRPGHASCRRCRSSSTRCATGCSTTATSESSSWTSSSTATSRTPTAGKSSTACCATPGRRCAACSAPSSRPRTSSRSTGAGGSDFYVFTTLEAGDDALARLAAQGAAGRGVAARHARRGVRLAHPQADRRLRRARGHPLRTRRCASSGSCTARCARRSASRRPRRRSARRSCARRSRRSCAGARIRTVYQPIFDLIDARGLRPRGADARSGRHGVREPGAALRVRRRARGDLGARAALHRVLGARTTRRTPGRAALRQRRGRTRSRRCRPGREALAPLFALRHKVVLEVTERSAIRDIPVFRDALDDAAARRASGSRSTTPDRATPRSSRSRSCGPTS